MLSVFVHKIAILKTKNKILCIALQNGHLDWNAAFQFFWTLPKVKHTHQSCAVFPFPGPAFSLTIQTDANCRAIGHESRLKFLVFCQKPPMQSKRPSQKSLPVPGKIANNKNHLVNLEGWETGPGVWESHCACITLCITETAGDKTKLKSTLLHFLISNCYKNTEWKDALVTWKFIRVGSIWRSLAFFSTGIELWQKLVLCHFSNQSGSMWAHETRFFQF